ncbi:hypothetical protein PROFUN_14406 [Planoprotostelium fungivorum]|uniref:Uncharacterized protein n=1 Tax=Planoprotostelium fungivorum TaxID=1890364 RepID=A0A2P6MTD3_9EUKA|nr:hypothetical protein PROFUN_16022 [Planoprotostelium fungivorum]PRP76300.1 hypothetical protein PROFUN_14406 [Planoprotostelium fungivorum]
MSIVDESHVIYVNERHHEEELRNAFNSLIDTMLANNRQTRRQMKSYSSLERQVQILTEDNHRLKMENEHLRGQLTFNDERLEDSRRAVDSLSQAMKEEAVEQAKVLSAIQKKDQEAESELRRHQNQLEEYQEAVSILTSALSSWEHSCVEIRDSVEDIRELASQYHTKDIEARKAQLKQSLQDMNSVLSSIAEYISAIDEQKRVPARQMGQLQPILEEMSRLIQSMTVDAWQGEIEEEGTSQGDSPMMSHIQQLGQQLETVNGSLSDFFKSIQPKTKKKAVGVVRSKDIERSLPVIMDDIYSSLIFKTQSQRMEYYKERDAAILKYKTKIKELNQALQDPKCSPRDA